MSNNREHKQAPSHPDHWDLTFQGAEALLRQKQGWGDGPLSFTQKQQVYAALAAAESAVSGGKPLRGEDEAWHVIQEALSVPPPETRRLSVSVQTLEQAQIARKRSVELPQPQQAHAIDPASLKEALRWMGRVEELMRAEALPVMDEKGEMAVLLRRLNALGVDCEGRGWVQPIDGQWTWDASRFQAAQRALQAHLSVFESVALQQGVRVTQPSVDEPVHAEVQAAEVEHRAAAEHKTAEDDPVYRSVTPEQAQVARERSVKLPQPQQAHAIDPASLEEALQWMGRVEELMRAGALPMMDEKGEMAVLMERLNALGVDCEGQGWVQPIDGQWTWDEARFQAVQGALRGRWGALEQGVVQQGAHFVAQPWVDDPVHAEAQAAGVEHKVGAEHEEAEDDPAYREEAVESLHDDKSEDVNGKHGMSFEEVELFMKLWGGGVPRARDDQLIRQWFFYKTLRQDKFPDHRAAADLFYDIQLLERLAELEGDRGVLRPGAVHDNMRMQRDFLIDRLRERDALPSGVVSSHQAMHDHAIHHTPGAWDVDVDALQQHIDDQHRRLQNDYHVSCEELQVRAKFMIKEGKAPRTLKRQLYYLKNKIQAVRHQPTQGYDLESIPWSKGRDFIKRNTEQGARGRRPGEADESRWIVRSEFQSTQAMSHVLLSASHTASPRKQRALDQYLALHFRSLVADFASAHRRDAAALSVEVGGCTYTYTLSVGRQHFDVVHLKREDGQTVVDPEESDAVFRKVAEGFLQHATQSFQCPGRGGKLERVHFCIDRALRQSPEPQVPDHQVARRHSL